MEVKDIEILNQAEEARVTLWVHGVITDKENDAIRKRIGDAAKMSKYMPKDKAKKRKQLDRIRFLIETESLGAALVDHCRAMYGLDDNLDSLFEDYDKLTSEVGQLEAHINDTLEMLEYELRD